jgi:hypothetical protein
MMQVPVDEVVNVIAVRHGRMTAPDPMYVRGIMATTPMRRRAARRMGVRHVEAVLLDDGPVLMMQVPVVQVIDVAVVQDGGVPAAGAMGVRMIGVM